MTTADDIHARINHLEGTLVDMAYHAQLLLMRTEEWAGMVPEVADLRQSREQVKQTLAQVGPLTEEADTPELRAKVQQLGEQAEQQLEDLDEKCLAADKAAVRSMVAQVDDMEVTIRGLLQSPELSSEAKSIVEDAWTRAQHIKESPNPAEVGMELGFVVLDLKSYLAHPDEIVR